MAVYPDIQLDEFWTAAIARTETARMIAVLGGANRGYKATDNYAKPESLDVGTPWGRRVFTPSTFIWPTPNAPGEARNLSFLFVAEVSSFADPNWKPNQVLEAIQAEAYNRLQDWLPSGFTNVKVLTPVWRWNPPQALPQYDDGRDVWYTSAEYRTNVFPVT